MLEWTANVADEVADIDDHHLPTDLDEAGALLRKLDGYILAADRFDVTKGESMWLVGKLLVQVWEPMPHGEKGAWLAKHINRSDSWAYEAKDFAKRFSRQDARALGYREMREAALAEKKGEKNGSAPGDGDSDAGRGKKNSRRGRKSSSGWTLNEHLPETLDRLLVTLAGDRAKETPSLADRIRATKDLDLLDNKNKSQSLILTQRAQLKLLSDALVEVAAALDEIEKELNDDVRTDQQHNREQFHIAPLVTSEVSGEQGEDSEEVPAVLPE